MACRLVGTKTISELMLICASIEFRVHISVKFQLKYRNFHSRKRVLKCLYNDVHFVSASTCWVCLRANIGIICNWISLVPVNNAMICKSDLNLNEFIDV